MADKTFNKLSHNLMQHLPFYELSNSEFNSLIKRHLDEGFRFSC